MSASVNTKDAEQLLNTLRSAVSNGASTRSNEAQATLTKLKILLTHFHLLPPFDADAESSREQLTIARTDALTAPSPVHPASRTSSPSFPCLCPSAVVCEVR